MIQIDIKEEPFAHIAEKILNFYPYGSILCANTPARACADSGWYAQIARVFYCPQ